MSGPQFQGKGDWKILVDADLRLAIHHHLRNREAQDGVLYTASKFISLMLRETLVSIYGEDQMIKWLPTKVKESSDLLLPLPQRASPADLANRAAVRYPIIMTLLKGKRPSDADYNMLMHASDEQFDKLLVDLVDSAAIKDSIIK